MSREEWQTETLEGAGRGYGQTLQPETRSETGRSIEVILATSLRFGRWKPGRSSWTRRARRVCSESPREDFAAVWAHWDDYCAGEFPRHRLRDMTRFSKYVISILHHVLEGDGPNAADSRSGT